MQEDKQRILNMVAEGKIKPEQGEQLLQALGHGEEAKSSVWLTVNQEIEKANEQIRSEINSALDQLSSGK